MNIAYRTIRYLPAAGLILLLFSFSLYAQDQAGGTVTGTVVDATTNLPLESVYAILQSEKDSSLVTGAVTRKNGKFTIKNIVPGSYSVKVSSIGFRDEITRPFTIDALHLRKNLETIFLRPDTVQLNEVDIIADRSAVDLSLDRKVYIIGQDVVDNAGSASDVLETLPSVQVDADGTVSLRGSPDVMIMINGKASPLLERRTENYLEQLPAGSIEKIEVITNPSAKESSEGKAGIINIVLKKNKVLGFHANENFNAGKEYRYNQQLRLNDHTGGVNIFANYSFRKDIRNRVNTDTRAESTGSSLSFKHYNSTLFSHSEPLSHLVTVGVDAHLDDQNSIGGSVNYLYNRFARNDSSFRVFRNSADVVTSEYNRISSGSEIEKEYGMTLYYQDNFSKKNNSLRIELNVTQSPHTEVYKFANRYVYPTRSELYDNALISQSETQYKGSVDYSLPAGSKAKIEAGYVVERSRAKLDYFAEYFIPGPDIFVQDANKTSQYGFAQTVHALYGNFKYSFGDLGINTGIRLEQTSRTSELLTLDSSVFNSYLIGYPSCFVSYKVNNDLQFQLSYSKRTVRPRARDLNPFPEFRDPKNISSGDPGIQPEYVHSLELGVQIEGDVFTLLPTLFYRYSSNSLTTIRELMNSATLVSSKENVATSRSAGMEAVLSFRITDIFTAHISATGLYEQLDASNLGFPEQKSKLSWIGTWTSNLNFTRSSRFQITSHVTSRRLAPQTDYFPSVIVNLGFRQEIIPGKLSFIATVSDVFQTMKRHYDLDIPRLQQTVVSTRDARVFYFGITYDIGSKPKKSADDQMQYDDEN